MINESGIDGIDFEKYEINLKNNLYKLWNRMTSGSYFPKAVRGVTIPKKNGKMRLLGIPTIEDRIAQMIVRNRLEPKVESIFHNDSYGYRPNKSAFDIIALSNKLNPIIRGWMNYFMKYNASEAFRKGINYVNLALVKWLKRTHKSVKSSIKKAHMLLL